MLHIVMWSEVVLVLANEYSRWFAPMLSTVVAVALAPVWCAVCGVLLVTRKKGSRDYWPLVSAILHPIVLGVLAWPIALAGVESTSVALGSTVEAIEQHTTNHNGEPPETLDELPQAHRFGSSSWRTSCQQPAYRKVSPYFGVHIYELGPGDGRLGGHHNSAFLRVTVSNEVRAADYGLDDTSLKHQLPFSSERWRQAKGARRRMARTFTSTEFHALKRKHDGDALAQATLALLGPPDRSYGPTAPWQLDLTTCRYAWGRVIYWPGERYPDIMDGMHLKGRIGAWAYYYDNRGF